MFRHSLQRLLASVSGRPSQPPTPEAVRACELPYWQTDARGRPRPRPEQLLEPDAYDERFAELLREGHAWLNLTYLGLLGEVGLVVIDRPRFVPAIAAEPTMLVFAGPPVEVALAGWSARDYVGLPG